MSNQNDGGGGFLWLVNTISDAVYNRRIEKYNKHSRGLEEYAELATDVLFPVESFEENIIVSGGDSVTRLKFSERIIRNCVMQGRPMVILHLGNKGIERIMSQNNWGTVANKNNKQFDAFTSFVLQEICLAVLDTCKAKYDIKPAGRYVLQIVYEILAQKKMRPYFSNFAEFDYHQIPESINDCLVSGLISQDTANKLTSLLMMGQAECAKIDAFFWDMKAELGHIAAEDASASRGTSILSAIRKGKSICIDLYSSSNAMLIELIVNSLTIAMNRGYAFSLFLDDVAIANNDMLRNALCQKSRHNNIIFSKDLYALLGGKDDIFTTITGEADKTLLLSHGSHVSCEKWSKYIGDYDKIDVSLNYGSGWSEGSIRGYSTNQGQSMTNKRENKIKPEEINRLSQSGAILYDNRTGSLIQATIV